MVFIDGRFHAGLSRIGPLNDNIRIVPLAQALTSGEAALESAFGNADEGGGPAALNLALAADGAYIDIPARTILDEPLHLVIISAGNATASFPRTSVMLGGGTEAVLVAP